MNTVPDDAITEAIQYLGMTHVQRIQQELVEGMRNGDRHGEGRRDRVLPASAELYI